MLSWAAVLLRFISRLVNGTSTGVSAFSSGRHTRCNHFTGGLGGQQDHLLRQPQGFHPESRVSEGSRSLHLSGERLSSSLPASQHPAAPNPCPGGCQAWHL